ncbi:MULTISPECIES: DUF4003 family protein [Clostridium]|uniref:DUF4003 family protein n=1 Tax=Clostridium TaxID=1485 RepID=UPI000C06CFFD|nr:MULTISPECIES: DUF4003 family protein [Clostridium]MDU2105608.1 DUF4003 family protein [Clostridium sp.]MDU3354436.1 DUF4003 family protein [Clostridium sp.]MDU4144701.1 DUF4003 family protein [Clostridium sp.]MDU4726119.1 DUF4003 family protein [Clostridium sp.]
MDVELRSKVDLLSDNYNDIRKALRWDGNLLNHFEALLYVRTDKEFSLEKIKEVRKYLDSRKLPYPFKGVFNKICSIMLDDRDDYVQVFNNTLYVYERLIQNGFKGNEKAAFASLMLAKRFFGKKLDNRINRIIDINSSLKDNDYISYANLSCTNRSVDRIRKELTEIENILKVTGRESSVDIKSFSTLLMIDEDNVETKVEKALNIMCNIKSELFEIPDKAYPLLGLATMLVEDPESFCVELKDIYNSLKNTKKYRYFMNRDLRIMISLGLLLNKYVEELKADLIDINVSDEINVFLALEECTVFSLSVI